MESGPGKFEKEAARHSRKAYTSTSFVSARGYLSFLLLQHIIYHDDGVGWPTRGHHRCATSNSKTPKIAKNWDDRSTKSF
jgi:hypothetical protein